MASNAMGKASDGAHDIADKVGVTNDVTSDTLSLRPSKSSVICWPPLTVLAMAARTPLGGRRRRAPACMN